MCQLWCQALETFERTCSELHLSGVCTLATKSLPQTKPRMDTRSALGTFQEYLDTGQIDSGYESNGLSPSPFSELRSSHDSDWIPHHFVSTPLPISPNKDPVQINKDHTPTPSSLSDPPSTVSKTKFDP